MGGAKINSPNGLQGVDNGSRHVAQTECVPLKQQVLKSDLLEWDSLTFGQLILSSYFRLINGLIGSFLAFYSTLGLWLPDNMTTR